MQTSIRSSATASVATPAALPPHRAIVTPASIREQVRDQVKAMVLSGELAPGELFSVNQLADRFQISRTPAREAALELVRDGLLTVERNRGFRVVAPSAQALDEIFEIRIF